MKEKPGSQQPIMNNAEVAITQPVIEAPKFVLDQVVVNTLRAQGEDAAWLVDWTMNTPEKEMDNLENLRRASAIKSLRRNKDISESYNAFIQALKDYSKQMKDYNCQVQNIE